MANKKFSEFTLKTDQSQVDYIVGYTGVENVQIEPEKVGLRYDLIGGVSGVSDYAVSLTDNNGGLDKVTLVAGDNIVLTDLSPGTPNAVQIDTKRGSVFFVTATFQNMFGGDPGIFGDTAEFGLSSSPASDHSSVLSLPIDCKLIGAATKWISDTPVAGIPTGVSWEVFVYPMLSQQLDTVDTASYGTPTKITGLDLTDSDNGAFPYKDSSMEIQFSKGDIINISGVEVGGAIPTSNHEVELVLVFETTTF